MIQKHLEINLKGTLTVQALIKELQEALDNGITNVEFGNAKGYYDGGRGGGAENYIPGAPVLVAAKKPAKKTKKK